MAASQGPLHHHQEQKGQETFPKPASLGVIPKHQAFIGKKGNQDLGDKVMGVGHLKVLLDLKGEFSCKVFSLYDCQPQVVTPVSFNTVQA